MTTYSGSGWNAEEINEAFIEKLQQIADHLLKNENFEDIHGKRRGALKIDLHKLIYKIKSGPELLMGASGIESFSLVKNAGETQGTLVLYKDKLVFAASAVYKINSYEEGHREAELVKVLSDLKNRAIQQQLTFTGNPDNFTLSRKWNFAKEEIDAFLNDVKKAYEGVKLRVCS